jgi:hypothetical protein
MEFFSNEKNNIIRVLKEAILVGILTVLGGYLASYIVRPFLKVNLPEICKSWNKNHVMEWSLFTTGFLIHIILEISGVNKKYAEYRSTI